LHSNICAAMSIIRTVFSRWFNIFPSIHIGEERAGTQDISSIPKNDSPQEMLQVNSCFEKSNSASIEEPQNFFNSIALRFQGYEKKFERLISPICLFSEMDETSIKKYFSKELKIVVNEAKKQPYTALKILSEKMAGNVGLYGRLVSIACGDSASVLKVRDLISRSSCLDELLVLFCLKEVAKFRPYETGHILSDFFERASIGTKLEILKEVVSSPLLGDKHMVGELFVRLMEHSTRDERKQEIYPILQAIINDSIARLPEARVKAAFLNALLCGWRSEFF